MKNKVELLRAICSDADDIKTITNLNNFFTLLEIDFMVEFKKIYELGLSQLKRFIIKLDNQGKYLDEYTIQYYVDVLSNGPLGSYLPEYAKGKKYFLHTPDAMGRIGNKTKSSPNTTLYEDGDLQIGANVDAFNKLPGFCRNTLSNAITKTESVFRSGLRFSMVYDNTLPIVDKTPQLRYHSEPKGNWALTPNGSYLVKDRYFYIATDLITTELFDSVKRFLGDENFRMWMDKKMYTPFEAWENTSMSYNTKLEKEFIENGETVIITVDILGDVFDSEKKRQSVLKVSSEGKVKTYKLNTNRGQLGNDTDNLIDAAAAQKLQDDINDSFKSNPQLQQDQNNSNLSSPVGGAHSPTNNFSTDQRMG